MMTIGGLQRLGFVSEGMTFDPCFCPYYHESWSSVFNRRDTVHDKKIWNFLLTGWP